MVTDITKHFSLVRSYYLAVEKERKFSFCFIKAFQKKERILCFFMVGCGN